MFTETSVIRAVSVFLSLMMLSACPGGGGSSNSGNNSSIGVSFDIRDTLRFSAVSLDFSNTGLDVGSNVPLVCITGGSIIGGHGLNCEDPHLHDPITIIDWSGPFDDPNQLFCGHGKVGIVAYKQLDFKCGKLNKPAMQLMLLNKFDSFNRMDIEYYQAGSSTPAKSVALTNDLSVGNAIPLADADPLIYDRFALYAACNKGLNASTGENDYFHYKISGKLSVTDSLMLKIGCTPYADTVSGDIGIGLAGSPVTGGTFYTGGRSIANQPLTAGATNAASWEESPHTTWRTGLVVANDMSRMLAYPFTFNPQAAPNVSVGLNELREMMDSDVDDSRHIGQAGFDGISVKLKAPGMFSQYYDLDPNSPPAGSRRVPSVPGIDGVGGIHVVRAMFSAVEPVTNSNQQASIGKYFVGLPAMIPFDEDIPAFINRGDILTLDSPTLNGFTASISYTPGLTGQIQYKQEARAETFDAGSNIRHHFRGEFYEDGTDANMTYPLDYLNATGVTTTFAPKGSDLTRLDLRYSSKPKEARRYDMYNQWPLADRDNEISLSVRYDF